MENITRRVVEQRFRFVTAVKLLPVTSFLCATWSNVTCSMQPRDLLYVRLSMFVYLGAPSTYRRETASIIDAICLGRDYNHANDWNRRLQKV